jgi:hypothetical protein
MGTSMIAHGAFSPAERTATRQSIGLPPEGPGAPGRLWSDETARRAVAGGPGRELPAPAQGTPGQPAGQKRPQGSPALQKVVNQYNAQRRLPPVDHSQYHPLDETFGRRVADAYDTLAEDNSADPQVRAAYQALIRETKAQYQHLVDNGYTLEPWTKPGQPYKNSHDMVADLRDNKHLYFFTGGESHPFLDVIDPDTGLTMNDMFRGVHDAYGHAASGYGFGARGEEGAHDVHSQSFSPLAQQALTTETRGQNSWVNFGRHNYDEQGNPLHLSATDKPYATQKVDILPPEFRQRAGERYATPSARQPEVTTRGPQPREPDVSGGRSAVVLEPSRMDPATRAEYSRFQDLLKTEGDNLGFDRTKQAVEAILMHEDWAARWDVHDPELIRLGNKFGGWEAERPTSFTTSQGSTYSIEGDSTTRTKSLHKFHDPTDIGEKAPSARTVYVSPEFAREVGMWNTLSSGGKRIILSKDGRVQLISRGPGGKPGLDRIINDNSFSTTPEVGRAPLELFQPNEIGHYAGNHPGSPITKLGGREESALGTVEDELRGLRQKLALPPGHRKGGPVHYDDGGEVDDEEDRLIPGTFRIQLPDPSWRNAQRLKLGLPAQLEHPGEFARQPRPIERRPGPAPKYAPQMLEPDRPVPEMPEPPVWDPGRFLPGKDVEIGVRQGLVSASDMFTKPAESIYGGRGPGGLTLSEINQRAMGPDPKEVEERSGGINRAYQFVGQIPIDLARWSAMTALTGGNPLAAAGAMGTLEHSGADTTPQEALGAGAVNVAMTAGLEATPRLIRGAASDARSMLPSREALEASRDAARQRLQQSGALSGGTAYGGIPSGQNIKDWAILTGSQLGLGGHKAGELWDMANAGAVRQEIRRLQAQLDPRVMEKLEAARKANPDFRAASQYLLPEEIEKAVRQQPNIETVAQLWRALPNEKHMAALAKFGAPKLGWYRGSARAIYDTFQNPVFEHDPMRAAQLLAAMSPQTSVESNLKNMLSMWKNWTAAGRPTDEKSIMDLMGASVQGGGTEESVLDAWVNNTIRVLQARDPRLVTLSGPKVDSFYHNLIGDVWRVTNDAWMANAFGVGQDLFSGTADPKQLARRDPGLSPGYYGTSARVRSGADLIGLSPREGQETIWSSAMQMYELAKKLRISPQEVLDRGLITPQVMRGTPDFSTLFREPEYRRLLEQAGYGPNISRMQTYEFPVQSANLSAAEQRYVDQTARQLGQLREMRDREAFASKTPVAGLKPEKVMAHEQVEMIPGSETGIFSGLSGEPWGARHSFTWRTYDPFLDLQGKDVLHQGLGFQTIPAQPMTGAYKPPTGPAEIQPGYSLPTAARVTGQGPTLDLPESVKRKLNLSAAVRGYVTGQNAAGWNAGIPYIIGTDLRLPMTEKATQQAMDAAVTKYPDLIFADTGGQGINVINPSGQRLSGTIRKDLENTFGSGKRIRTRNINDLINYARDWGQTPGSGAATRRLVSIYDQATASERAAADTAIQQPAAKLLREYLRYAKNRKQPIRQDFVDALQIVSTQGLSALKQALQSGVALPAGIVAALQLAPSEPSGEPIAPQPQPVHARP